MSPQANNQHEATQTESDASHQQDELAPTVTAEPTPRQRLGRSRMGGLWVALILGAFVLILLLVFILQNGQRVQLSFFGAQGQMPLGVAMLLAAMGGALIVAVPGSARIVQLRRSTKAARRESASRP